MTPAITTDDTAAVPVYEQIRSQIAGAILAGSLSRGDRLPPARTLADNLGIAVNTVIRAYRELAAAGLIASRRRHGTVVDSAQLAPAEVVAAATRLALRARAAGLSVEQTLDLLRAAGVGRPA